MTRRSENAGENASETDAAAEPANPRVSVQLDGDGGIAWERMRPDTVAKLRNAMFKSMPAQSTSAPSMPVVESIPPELCEVMYDSLSMLLIGLARRGGHTQEQAQVLTFSDHEKKALVPATVKVLDKYNASLGKYAEEITLGVLLVTITSGKLAALKKSAQVIAMTPRGTDVGGSQAEI